MSRGCSISIAANSDSRSLSLFLSYDRTVSVSALLRTLMELRVLTTKWLGHLAWYVLSTSVRVNIVFSSFKVEKTAL